MNFARKHGFEGVCQGIEERVDVFGFHGGLPC